MTKTTRSVWQYAFGIVLTISSLTTYVQAQSVTIDPNGPVVCAGTQLNAVATGLNAPLTYLWSNGATTSSIIVTQTNFYRVRVRGFVGSNQVTVFSSWTPLLVIPGTNATINPSGPIDLCPGQSATLSGSGGQFFSSYAWSNGATTRNITVNQTGTYTLTVTNQILSCTTSSSASVDVEAYDSGYQPAITALSPITVCQPGFVNLAADPGFSSYSWSTGSTAQNVSVLMDGSQAGAVLDTQTVTLTVGLNGGQCFFTNPGVVLRSVRQPELIDTHCGVLTFTPTDSIKAGLVLTYLTAPQYEFEFEETTNPGTTFSYTSNTRWCNLANVSPAIQANKFYLVRVRAVIGGTPYCYGDPCVIGVVNNPGQNNTLRVSDGTNALVFPNPSAESFRLMLNGFNTDEMVTVNITDLAGRLMDTFNYDPNAGAAEFGKSFNNGIYLVTARQGDKTTVTRIVKTN